MGPSLTLLMINVPEDQWSLTVEEDRKLLGCSPEADGVLPCELRGVGEFHAEAWSDRHGTWIRDLGTKTGTKVNAVLLPRMASVRMQPGDLIGLGEVLLEASLGPKRRLRIHPDDLPEEEATTEGPEGVDAGMFRKYRQQAESARLLTLTPSEFNIVMFVQRGLVTDAELGDVLGCSPHTVRTHMASIFSKLDVHSRDQLVALLLRIAAERDGN
jgi:DNA-binding CsgD family transcriptional regulator